MARKKINNWHDRVHIHYFLLLETLLVQVKQLGIFPPGLRLNWSDVSQTFDSAVNGASDSTTMESIKGYILSKNTATLEFHKNPVFF